MTQNQKRNNLVWIGTVVNTHGIKGEVRVLSNSEEIELNFKSGNIIKYIKDDKVNELEISNMRVHKNFILLTFKGIKNINNIEWLKGLKIYNDALKLEDDEYYLSELIDKEVFDQNNNSIGVATSLMNQGPYESLVVKLKNNKTTNIPILDEFEFEFDGDKIKVKIPDEFIE